MIFLSTPSGWRATTSYTIKRSDFLHFYPRPPGGGRQQFPEYEDLALLISIHALRVEGDEMDLWAAVLRLMISIHALRVEGDSSPTSPATAAQKFLSTPSGWRATAMAYILWGVSQISIHALRVEGDKKRDRSADRADISIHALRVEGDEVMF